MKRQNDFPNPKFILIMNYILLFLFATMTALTANAQVETEAVTMPYSLEAIPKQFRYSSNTACIGNAQYDDNGIYSARIYDEDLNLQKKFELLGFPDQLTVFDSNENASDYGVYFTQTLFNDDEKIEYVVLQEGFDENFGYYPKNMQIISEDGTILQTLEFPTGRYRYSPHLCLIGKNYYIRMEGNDEYSGFSYFYKINKDASDPSKVSISTEPKRMSVSPRMVGRNEDITVAAETEDLRDVVVTDASGRRVYSTRVGDGQRAVRINANRLNPGMNVVNVKDANGKNEDFKVIVK